MRWSLCAGLLLGLLWVGRAAEPQEFDLPQALERAWSNNAGLKAAELRVDEAQARLAGAGSLPGAQIGVTGLTGNGPGLVNSNYTNLQRSDYYLWINQNFPAWGTMGSKRRSAEAALAATRAEVRGERLRLAQSVKDNFYRLLAAQLQEQVAGRNLELADENLRIAEKRLQAGEAPRLDRVQAGIERSKAAQEQVRAQAQVRRFQTQLAPLLGLERPAELLAKGRLQSPELADVARVLESTLELHPRLEQARRLHERDHQETELAARQGNPTAGINLIQDLVVPNYVLQLNLAIPIDWGELGHEVQARRQTERQSELQLEQTRRELSSELRQAYDDYMNAYTLQLTYFQDVLQPAESMATTTEFGYRRGAVPYLQLVNAQRLVSDSRREYIEQQLAVQLALNALENALGEDLPRP